MKQNTFTSLLLVSTFLMIGFSSIAQSWDLEKHFDDIKIFTRSVADSDLKELKIEFSLDLNLAPIVSLLNNSDVFNDWVYNSKVFEPLTELGPGNGFYYGIVDFPWPLEDRDYVIHTCTKQDPVSKVVTIESMDAEHKTRICNTEYVRIPNHHNRWTLTPVSSNKTDLVYWLKSDPGGAIPKWLINLAIDKGATQTILNMKSKLACCQSNLQLAYIQEK